MEQPRIQEIAEVEAHNLSQALINLGEGTLQVLTELQSAYLALPPLVALPEDETTALVGYSCVHLLAMSCRQLSMGALTLMRGYRGDAMMHLRRAIEATAFAVRISKHPDTVRAWLNASDNEAAYEEYRSMFRPSDLFPKAGKPDHDPILAELKERYDRCSRVAHGSIFGLGGHFEYKTGEKFEFKLNYFDLPHDHSIISLLFLMYDSHRKMLDLFGRALESYTKERITEWRVRLNAAEAKMEIERNKWKPYVPDPRKQVQAGAGGQ